MEFGLFVQAHVPQHEVAADPEGAEHGRLLRELELACACDRSGWKYVWSVVLASTQPQEVALRSVELFGQHVIPRFDHDPLHRTVRMREQAAGNGR
jgi:hypothetical protein